jgi:hypothetical protein
VNASALPHQQRQRGRGIDLAANGGISGDGAPAHVTELHQRNQRARRRRRCLAPLRFGQGPTSIPHLATQEALGFVDLSVIGRLAIVTSAEGQTMDPFGIGD